MSLSAQAQDLNLWYETPARYFEEALPIGNGRIGAMIYGGADCGRANLSTGSEMPMPTSGFLP